MFHKLCRSFWVSFRLLQVYYFICHKKIQAFEKIAHRETGIVHQIYIRDLCINMNNHQNAIFHQFENFLKTPLALLGVDLKNSKINKICHFANHPYLCKGLVLLFFINGIITIMAFIKFSILT